MEDMEDDSINLLNPIKPQLEWDGAVLGCAF